MSGQKFPLPALYAVLQVHVFYGLEQRLRNLGERVRDPRVPFSSRVHIRDGSCQRVLDLLRRRGCADGRFGGSNIMMVFSTTHPPQVGSTSRIGVHGTEP